MSQGQAAISVHVYNFWGWFVVPLRGVRVLVCIPLVSVLERIMLRIHDWGFESHQVMVLVCWSAMVLVRFDGRIGSERIGSDCVGSHRAGHAFGVTGAEVV